METLELKRNMEMPAMTLKGRVAVGVPTYNRSRYIHEALQQKMADDYASFGIDIYYYDSSSNDETKQLIEEYRSRGCDNLHYISLPNETLLDTKLMLIMKGYQMETDYDYLWICRDSSWFSKRSLERLEDAILNREGYDVIVLNPENVIPYVRPEPVDAEYSDALLFYHNVG